VILEFLIDNTAASRIHAFGYIKSDTVIAAGKKKSWDDASNGGNI
jgi:hypothetical protein